MRISRIVWTRLNSVLLGLQLLALLAACGGTSPQATPPAKPGEFGIVSLVAFCMDADGAGIIVEWSGAERAEEYIVLRDGAELVTLGAAARTFSDTGGVAEGATVGYQVRAVNAGGESVTGGVEIAVPADLCDSVIPAPPAPVTGFSADYQCGPVRGVQLSWAAVAGATDFVLERDHVVIAELEADELGYLDSDARAGESNTYVLKAVNDVGVALSAPLLHQVPFADCGVQGPVVSAGGYHTLAIAQDGTVWAWGENWDGQLGAGYYSEGIGPVNVMGLDRVVAVAAGSFHSLALDEDGQLWGWGYNSYGQLGLFLETIYAPRPIDVPGTVVAISSGVEHTLALTADGRVWAWGDNYLGQTGQDPADYNSSPEPQRLEGPVDVVDVVATALSSFLLHSDGTVSAFGNNDTGMLGVGHDNDIHVPEPVVNLSQVIQIAGSDEHALALTSTGEVYVWGDGDLLGMGDSQPDSFEPILNTALTDVVWISAAYNRSLAVTGDGRVLVWGEVKQELGENAADTWRYEPMAVAGIDDAVAAYSGYEHTVAMLEGGRLVNWGANEEAQLGQDLPFQYDEFVPVMIDQPVEMVRSGHDNSLALLADGTVLGWGDEYTGVAGFEWNDPVGVPAPVGSLSDIIAIEVGDAFSLALDADGDVWSWGSGSYGRTGHGDTLRREQPTRIPLLDDITQISAGRYHSLAIDEDGFVWTWGRNNYGQLGDGSSTDSSTPIQVGLVGNAVSVSAGEDHSLAVLEDGSVWAWGRNVFGQLGQGNTTAYTIRLMVLGLPNPLTNPATRVFAASGSSYVQLSDGSVWAWGLNSDGQLGYGAYSSQYSAAEVVGLPADTQISVSYRTVLAVTSSGDLYGWGSNEHWQMGMRAPERIRTVEQLSPPGRVSSAVAGRNQSFLIIEGALYAAGDDSNYLLGVGRVAYSTEPLEVLGDVPLAGM